MFYKEDLVFTSAGRSNYRIPSVIATNKGTVLAFCNDRKDTLSDAASETTLALAVKKQGADWSEVREILCGEGFACGIGSAVYDAETGIAMCTAGRGVAMEEFGPKDEEKRAAMRKAGEERAKELGLYLGGVIVKSEDDGETWTEEAHTVAPVEHTHWDGTVAKIGGSCHGSAHGIQLRHGEHKGRLLCPSRTSIGTYSDWEGLKKCVYNNAIYSDDHGKTWQASKPVQLATGEGTLIERQDGSILYNSRAYFKDQKRYLADSTDGGATYGNFRTDDFLLEEAYIGCNASFLRVEAGELKGDLPNGADSITIFANPRSEARENMTLCVSFDSGETYVKTKQIWAGPAAYSSLVYNAVDGHFYLMYEKGFDGKKNPYEQGIAIVEFDLDWLLAE